MHRFKHTVTGLCFLFALPLAADTTRYQTAPKSAPVQDSQYWSAPLISVNPATGKTRVFIQPDGSFSNSLVSHDRPVYHARTFYEASSEGITASQLTLHQQMQNTCPLGWIKLQEWASLQSDIPELHYQFQCLTALPQD